MTQPLVAAPPWQPSDLRELQRQLEILLIFCEDDQLAAGGMCRATADRLLGAKGDWNYAEMTAVMAVVSLDLAI